MVFGQSLNTHRIFKRLTKARIRLRICAGFSEPLLLAHTTLLQISCCGSFAIFGPIFMKCTPKSRTNEFEMMFTILGSVCSILDWEGADIRPQTRPKKIPVI